MPLLADEELEVSKRYGVTGWLGPLARFTELKDAPGGRYVMRAVFVIDGEGVVRYRHVSRTGSELPVGRRPRAGRRRPGLMPADARRPSCVHGRHRPAIRGEAAGEGPADRPLPRPHRDPPLGHPRFAGAGARRPQR